MPPIVAAPMKPHTPIQEYVYRIPRPPSYWVASPVVELAEELNLQKSTSYDYELTGFANVDFLKTVNHANLKAPQSISDWDHGQRWAAQAILPFLYLGPTSVIRDGIFLRQHGITMILRIRLVLTSGAKSLDVAVANPGIELHTVDVEGMQDLIAAFPRGIKIINAHMSELFNKNQLAEATSKPVTNLPSGAVLVCCETGNERSPCMVAAYMMAMYTIHFAKAIRIVQTQRFSVTISEESKNVLQTYHSILEAQRNVIRSNTADPNPTSRNAEIDSSVTQTKKRSLDDLYDNEIYSDEACMTDSGLLIGRREGQAPFQDG